MPSLVVNGAQWGDEGKGKLVDCLTAQADWVVRFQGGNNAGHTLVVDGVKIKLQLTPCGILRPKARCLIAAGVVANPDVIISEIAALAEHGIEVNPDRLVIDRDAHMVLDYHPVLDRAREASLGDSKIGTTGRGIGPAYEDRAARCGVRFAELLDLPTLKPRLEALVAQKNRIISAVFNFDEQVEFSTVWETVKRAADRLSAFIGNGSLLLDESLRRNEKVVFEGAQATLLDINFGTVPFVTSSSTLAGAVSTGCGIGPKHVDYILGVAKAYCTRVGAGPFPTEAEENVAQQIREKGQEFGTVTGRPRRCGWMDIVALKRSIRLNGYDSLAIMKLDVLSGISQIKVGVQYKANGKPLSDIPALSRDYDQVTTEYANFEGWSEVLVKATKKSDLPSTAVQYIQAIEDLAHCPISLVSVGPDRTQLINWRSDAPLNVFIGS